MIPNNMSFFRCSNIQIQNCTYGFNLYNNIVPWVKNAKHKGNLVSNLDDGFSQDVQVKRTSFIGKNCEILQEFLSGHPED